MPPCSWFGWYKISPTYLVPISKSLEEVFGEGLLSLQGSWGGTSGSLAPQICHTCQGEHKEGGGCLPGGVWRERLWARQRAYDHFTNEKWAGHKNWKIKNPIFGRFFLEFFVTRLASKEKKIIMANQTTVHSGGVSRGRLTGCGCWRGCGCGSYKRFFFNFHVSMSVSLLS